VLDFRNTSSFDVGEILVTHSNNPIWTPLFTLLGAIVTEMGNYLLHGADVAREAGIPAVGNVFNATLNIKSWHILILIGGTGIVSIQP
jgi:phosphoenolpyruvate synthase/pyruvate phosphate dikinase